MKRTVLLVLGIVIALASLAIAGGAFANLLTEGRSEAGANLAALVIMLAATFAGGMLAWANLHPRRTEAADGPDLEHRILALAHDTDGRLTIPEVALRCRASLAESKETLSRMVRAGIANVELTDQGDMVYVFTSFLPSSDERPPGTSARDKRRERGARKGKG